jgi:two-component system, chemotaxis family, CheB/CheR fusion protein
LSADLDPDLQGLLDHFRDQRGVDLMSYKPTGLTRRVRKRMAQVGAHDYGDYRRRLERDDDELNALLDTILINVTAFFRDTDTWDHLRDHVVPSVLATKAPGAPIRAWSAGCSSGEEACSLAITLTEALGDEYSHRVKIYATDIDVDALATARRAEYPPQRLADVHPLIVERYFEPSQDSYRLRRDLRQSLVFGRHDLAADPPISRIDLLLCRNTLMYFTAATQRAVLERLHFATREGGYLVLGRAESLSTRTNIFAPLDPTQRVYLPVDHLDPSMPVAATRHGRRLRDCDTMSVRAVGFEVSPVPQILVDHDGILVAANTQALSTLGLRPSDLGRPLQDLEVSYRPLEVRSRIEEAHLERRTIVERGVSWTIAGSDRFFDVAVTPFATGDGQLDGINISYTDVTRQHRLEAEALDLRAQLATANEDLQSAVEEVETTNEELQSTNEELETTNEELQSTNEELETMNAELQSTNEELQSINVDLQTRSAALDQAKLALEAVLTSLQSAVVVLSPDLRVEMWNAHAEELWGVRSDEVEGEHFMNLDIGLPVDSLHQPIRQALTGHDSDHSDDSDIVIDAVNRRGRKVTCRIRVTALRRADGTIIGAILLMDAEDGSAGPHR